MSAKTANLPSQVPVTARLKFVDEYLIDLNPRAAAARAGINPDLGSRLLAVPSIQKAIKQAKESRSSRTQIFADEVQRRYWMLFTADARELGCPIRINCRYCYGKDHDYQFMHGEMLEARQRHKEKMYELPVEMRWDFDERGGAGYDLKGQPNPACPHCKGRGEITMWYPDMRDISPSAAMLCDGFKVHKDGSIQVLLRNREKAGDLLAQHLGMKVERKVSIEFDPTRMSDEQLEATLEAFYKMKNGEAPPVMIEHDSS